MSFRAEVLTTVCTVSCALVIGYWMQSGEVADLRYGANSHGTMSDARFVGEPVLQRRHAYIRQDGAIDIGTIILTSGKVVTSSFAVRPDGPTETALNENAEADADPDAALSVNQGSDCAITSEASPVAGAMIDFSLHAPCHANVRVTISHADLRFAEVIPDDGVLISTIPALTENGIVKAAFATGEKVKTNVEVSSLELYDRVVVQSKGTAGMQMHAREFGANYGDDGHVWSGAGRTVAVLSEGRGGFLTSLGDDTLPDPRTVEIYTFPTTPEPLKGAVNLTIETRVTDENCGRDISAQATQITAGRKTSDQTLTLTMPECGQAGLFLVLNNLLQDLTVAAK
ncbi:MAG: hypothetical protein AAGF27_05205 [Pseudomonadota bacterium]